MVPTGHWHGTMQAVLGCFKGLLPDHGRHRHGNPLLRWSGLLTLARTHGLQSGLAPACRRGASPATLGNARGGRRAQNAPYRSDIPAFSTPGRGHVGLAEALRSLRQAWGLAGVGRPGKHVLHHGRLHWVKTHAAGIARAVGITQRAIGARVQGSSWPLRRLAWRPRRMRSAIKVRSYSATAERMCHRR